MSPPKQPKHRSRGFTIVELLIVIVVIGILAAITIVAYTGIQQKATVASLQSDLTNASQLLKIFQVDNSAYPVTINCAIADSPTNKCIKSSGSTAYLYSYSNSNPQVFCMTATNNGYRYNLTQDGTPLAGPCPILNLDAGNTASYSGAGTTWNDISGNNNNGTLVGGVTYVNTAGGALSFDGVGGYVDAGNGPSLSMADAITLEAWAKWSTWTLHTYQGIVFKANTVEGAGGCGTNYSLASGWGSFLPDFFITTVGGSICQHFTGNTTLSLNTWYHFVGTYDSNTGQARVYINGVLDGSTTYSGKIPVTPYSAAIGKGPAGLFPGTIGKVRVYNKALTADEVKQNFDSLRGRYGL